MGNITFSCFSYSIKARTRLFLPAYKGSTLRGGFGHAFRRACCVARSKDCHACFLKDSCVYSWVFETPIPKDAALMRKYTSAPHPFVLEPPLGQRRQYEPGERLDFGMTLVGRAVDYLPHFIYSFHQLGKMGLGKDKGRFDLEKVAYSPVLKDMPVKVLYKGDGKMLEKPPSPAKWSEIAKGKPPDKVTLSFLTPARIKYKGSFANDLDFHILLRNLLRRASLLAYFHCGFKLDDYNFSGLIEQAKQIRTSKSNLYWHDWTRWSNRQRTRMKMGGVKGEITYEGDLSPFWSYIRLGEYVHVGKGSSFGLGRYEVKITAVKRKKP